MCNNIPNLFGINTEVVVCNDIAKPFDLLPRNRIVFLFEAFVQSRNRFADNDKLHHGSIKALLVMIKAICIVKSGTVTLYFFDRPQLKGS